MRHILLVVILSFAVLQCRCTVDCMQRVNEIVFTAHDRIDAARESRNCNNETVLKIDSSGLFTDITGIPSKDDTIGLIAELAVTALLRGNRCRYLFIRSNRKINALSYYGARIYRYRRTGLQRVLGRERSTVTITIGRYTLLTALKERIFRSCSGVDPAKKRPEYVVTVSYEFRGKRCGADGKEMTYYISRNEDMQFRITGYRRGVWYSGDCRPVIAFPEGNNRFLVGCGKVKVEFCMECNSAWVVPYGEESSEVLDGITIDGFTNGKRLSLSADAVQVRNDSMLVDISDVDSLALRFSAQRGSGACGSFEYVVH